MGYIWEGIFARGYLGGYIQGIFGRGIVGVYWRYMQVKCSRVYSGYIWEGVYLGYIGGLCRENAAEGSVYLEGILSRVKHRAYALNIPESGTTRNKHIPS